MSAEADVVIGAGDFASVHEGLGETIDALAVIETPTVLVPGNNETEDALREAASGWSAATVLHGSGTTIDGVEFYGLGAGHPGHALGLELRPRRRGRRRDAGALPAGCGAGPPLAPARPLRRQRFRRSLRQPGPAAGDRGEGAARWRSAATSTSPGAARARSATRRSATSARRAPGSRSRRRGSMRCATSGASTARPAPARPRRPRGCRTGACPLRAGPARR